MSLGSNRMSYKQKGLDTCFFNIFFKFIIGCGGLHCCMQAFSSCSKQGYPLVAMQGLLLAWLLLLWSTSGLQ